MGSDLFGRGQEEPSSFLMSDIGEADYDPLDTNPLLRFSPRKIPSRDSMHGFTLVPVKNMSITSRVSFSRPIDNIL